MKQENGKRAMTAGLRRTMVIFVLDLLCIAGSFFLALWMRFEFRLGAIPQMYLNEYLKIIGPWIVICLVVFQLFRLYNSIWSFVSIDELFRIILAYGVLLAAGLAYVLILKIDMPRSFYFAGFIMSFMSTTALRFSYRFMRQLMAGISTEKSERDRILMIGAGEAGRQLIREINSNPRLGSRVVCIIDDNPSKRRRYLDGVEIAGGRQEIPDAVKKYQVNKIIFAIPTCDGQDRKEILDICSKTGCRVQAVPGMFQLVNGEVSVSKLRDVELQDLLGRDPIQVNLEEICRYISGKVVMVTGGGGSIGSELCRQIARHNPKQLIVVDIYENNAYDIQQELRYHYGSKLDLRVEIASIRDRERVNQLFATYHPDVVFHAAAHKHVPLMEDSPQEAVRNNVFGTLNLVQAADAYGVGKFIQISTDKAVNPTSVMGATKRLCEIILQSMKGRSKTTFAAVRFGNVLGSNGSVVPLFQRQIAAGGPVTVTDKRIIRYFMTITEATELVLQVGAMAHQNELYVLDMGRPVKILDLAENMIRLSGYVPYRDIDIIETGLRPGEKLYEELLVASRDIEKTENDQIFVERQPAVTPEELRGKLAVLEAALEKNDPSVIRGALHMVVPHFHEPEDFNNEQGEEVVIPEQETDRLRSKSCS